MGAIVQTGDIRLPHSADHKHASESGKTLARKPVPAPAPPHQCGPHPATPLCLPLLPRARVWIGARHLFRRGEAQSWSWLWTLRCDGRVVALRVLQQHHGCDRLLPRLLVHFNADPETPLPLASGADLVWPLPHASRTPRCTHTSPGSSPSPTTRCSGR